MERLEARRVKRRARRGQGGRHIVSSPRIIAMDFEARGLLGIGAEVAVVYSDDRTRFFQLTDVNSDDMKAFITEMSRRVCFPPTVFDLPIDRGLRG